MLTVLAWFVVLGLAVQWVGVALALSALWRPNPADARRDSPGITILRPVCGLENQLEETDVACVFVSHDRYFTRTAATRFLEIRRGKLVEVESPEGFFAGVG